MLEFGSNLGMPHTKSVDGGLFELRVKSKKQGRDSASFLLHKNWKTYCHAACICQKDTENTQKGIEAGNSKNERGTE